MLQTSYIEINRDALKQNLKYIQSILKPKTRFSSVVKGNAYGHGIDIYVPLAAELGVDHFSVFSAYEAARVMEVNDNDARLMIMGMLDADQMQWAIYNKIEFYVFNVERLRDAIRFAAKIEKKALIHLEMETGMNRTGFRPEQIPEVTKLILASPNELEIMGFCTHYAGSESIANHYRIQKQRKRFELMCRKFESLGVYARMKHTACSAASIKYPDTQMDLCRIGILQFGFFPSKEVLVDHMMKRKISNNPLKRLISWKSRIMDVKPLNAGEFVGYGTSYLANSDMQIAIVPVGYSQGFSRSLSNQGRVLIHGKRVPVIGMVNMNMITVDVSGMEGVKAGDEVVLIGEQGNLEITVSSFSEFSDQVNYELLTRLPHEIPRKIV